METTIEKTGKNGKPKTEAELKEEIRKVANEFNKQKSSKSEETDSESTDGFFTRIKHILLGAGKVASDKGANVENAKRVFSWEGLIAVVIAALVTKSGLVLSVGLLIIGLMYGYKTGEKIVASKGNILKPDYLWLLGALLLIVFAPGLTVYTLAICVCGYTFYKAKSVLDS